MAAGKLQEQVYTVANWTIFRRGYRITLEEALSDVAKDPDDPIYTVDTAREFHRHGWRVPSEEVLRDVANMAHALMRPCPECRAFLAAGDNHKMGCSTAAGRPNAY